ncbi:hypothetical protein CLAIMM_01821 [Cladophialophora immunda]|nr:hypothetical protein CLAIMM_01821 [Cladophialophora immunda]
MNREDKRVRNRLSQKAFRARQAMRIKELEQRLESRPGSESERVSKLEECNKLLRERLFDNHKKMESLQVSLQALIDSTAKYLDLMINEDTSSSLEDISTSNNASSPTPQDRMFHYHEPAAMSAVQCPTTAENFARQNLFDLDHASPRPMRSIQIGLTTRGKATIPKQNPLNDPLSQLPLSFTIAQFSPTSYAATSQSGPILFTSPQGQLHATSSMLSNHINSMEFFLKLNMSNFRLPTNRGAPSHLDGSHLTAAVSLIFSTFVTMSWQTMTAWHAYLRVQPDLTGLMEWRVNPNPDTLSKIPPYYRPTQLQLSVNYPAVIDWMPWPSIRDALITYHSANPRLDDLIFEIASSYVMEIDLSKLVAGFPPTPGYVSVWDLVQAISPETICAALPALASCSEWECSIHDGASANKAWNESRDETNEPTTLESSLPASSTRALFESKGLAFQAFKLLGMDNGPHQYKLGPAFFARHPELYEPSANIMAAGVFLHPGRRWSLAHPQPLDNSILARYREVTSWTLNPHPRSCPQTDTAWLG